MAIFLLNIISIEHHHCGSEYLNAFHVYSYLNGNTQTSFLSPQYNNCIRKCISPHGSRREYIIKTVWYFTCIQKLVIIVCIVLDVSIASTLYTLQLLKVNFTAVIYFCFKNKNFIIKLIIIWVSILTHQWPLNCCVHAQSI